MSSVHIYTSPSGKRNSFEATATHLLSYSLWPIKEHQTIRYPVRSQTHQKSKYLALGPRLVSGRQDFISDTTIPLSMLLYTKTRSSNSASGDSRTLTASSAQKDKKTSAQIETSPYLLPCTNKLRRHYRQQSRPARLKPPPMPQLMTKLGHESFPS